jgi:uncharacterized membrane protein (DUF4010 family)
MSDLFASQAPALGFLLAAVIGFLIGRTREESGHVPRPGIRDFVIIALLGAICGHLGEIALTVGGLAATTVVLVVARLQHPERTGVTTELGALATFLIGYLCLTPALPFGAALGIVVAIALAAKSPLHHFALEIISEREFADTLRFLALIFIVFAVLPTGSYGPFGFVEPRTIWLFVVLICGVSFVGYFATKFLDAEKGMVLSALFGGLASSTAYTGAVARTVRETPESAVALARATLLANSIMPPRMLLTAAVVSPQLAIAALPTFGAMTVAGLVSAWLLGRAGASAAAYRAGAGFKNPFSLGPALRFGLVFAVVLFMTRAAKHYLGDSGMLASSAISGLIDVYAVTLSLAGFINAGDTKLADAVLALVLAAATNNAFKSGLAVSSGQPAFYGRVVAGLLIAVAVALATTLATR